MSRADELRAAIEIAELENQLLELQEKRQRLFERNKPKKDSVSVEVIIGSMVAAVAAALNAAATMQQRNAGTSASADTSAGTNAGTSAGADTSANANDDA